MPRKRSIMPPAPTPTIRSKCRPASKARHTAVAMRACGVAITTIPHSPTDGTRAGNHLHRPTHPRRPIEAEADIFKTCNGRRLMAQEAESSRSRRADRTRVILRVQRARSISSPSRSRRTIRFDRRKTSKSKTRGRRRSRWRTRVDRRRPGIVRARNSRRRHHDSASRSRRNPLRRPLRSPPSQISYQR